MVKQRSNWFNGTTNCPIVAFQGKKMQRTLVEGLAAHQLALRNKNNRFYTNHLPMDFEFAPSSEISCHAWCIFGLGKQWWRRVRYEWLLVVKMPYPSTVTIRGYPIKYYIPANISPHLLENLVVRILYWIVSHSTQITAHCITLYPYEPW